MSATLENTLTVDEHRSAMDAYISEGKEPLWRVGMRGRWTLVPVGNLHRVFMEGFWGGVFGSGKCQVNIPLHKSIHSPASYLNSKAYTAGLVTHLCVCETPAKSCGDSISPR